MFLRGWNTSLQHSKYRFNQCSFILFFFFLLYLWLTSLLQACYSSISAPYIMDAVWVSQGGVGIWASQAWRREMERWREKEERERQRERERERDRLTETLSQVWATMQSRDYLAHWKTKEMVVDSRQVSPVPPSDTMMLNTVYLAFYSARRRGYGTRPHSVEASALSL